MGVFYKNQSASTTHTLYKRKKWNGSVIDKCKICSKKIQLNFIYGRLKKCKTMWLVMCVSCSSTYGESIRFGMGYVYRIREDGHYYKV